MCIFSRTAPRRGASDGGGYPVTAWRTTCLYGVSYSRASPRLFVGVTSSVSARTARSPTCECGRGVVCHRMAHYVLIRCFLQPSLSEALPGCYLRQ